MPKFVGNISSPGGGERLALVAMLLTFALVLSVLGILTLGQDVVIKGLPDDKASAQTVELRRERYDTRVYDRPLYQRNSEPSGLKLQGLVPEE